jgi:hypothetical protein
MYDIYTRNSELHSSKKCDPNKLRIFAAYLHYAANLAIKPVWNFLRFWDGGVGGGNKLKIKDGPRN